MQMLARFTAFVSIFKNILKAELPTKGTPGSAAHDLYAATITLDEQHDRLIVDTGLSSSFDSSMVMLVFGRSGLAMKHGIRLANSVAVIDSDYRGPIKVILKSDTLKGIDLFNAVKVGDRVAQAVFLPVIAIDFIQVWHKDELEPSKRGDGGFGSTGA